MGRNEPNPAIVRDYTTDDKEATVRSTPYDGVTHKRGLGESGYRVEIVEYRCPCCSFDRMVRRVDVSPETRDEVRYWCLNPNCPHFVENSLRYAMHTSPRRGRKEPEIVERKS